MYVFNRYQQKVIEADEEIQKLKRRILELEAVKSYYRFADAHSVESIRLRRKRKSPEKCFKNDLTNDLK